MEKKLVLGSKWFEEIALTTDEKNTGKCSQARLMRYLFDSMILANYFGEKLEFDSEIIAGDFYDEENETYMEIFQYFIVETQFHDEELKTAFNNASVDWVLFYNEEYDLYFLGVGNLGTNRGYIMTDLNLYEMSENNYESTLFED